MSESYSKLSQMSRNFEVYYFCLELFKYDIITACCRDATHAHLQRKWFGAVAGVSNSKKQLWRVRSYAQCPAMYNAMQYVRLGTVRYKCSQCQIK